MGMTGMAWGPGGCAAPESPVSSHVTASLSQELIFTVNNGITLAWEILRSSCGFC